MRHVHGGIRHLEMRQGLGLTVLEVHGGIRHLEIVIASCLVS